MIADRFVEHIYNNLEDCEKEKKAIIFNNGLQYDVITKRCVSYSFVHNHFSTLINKRDEHDCIFYYNHMEIDKYVKTIEISNENPLWMEIVHESNISNRMHFVDNIYI